MTARFSIGIDLGTTSSALAYVPLTGDAPPEVLAVSQWQTPDALVEVPTLPSFLYLPKDALATQLRAGFLEQTDGLSAASRAAGQAKRPAGLSARQSRGCVTTRPTGPRQFCRGDRRILRRRKRFRPSRPLASF